MNDKEQIVIRNEEGPSWSKSSFYYLVLTIAGLSTILRPSPESSITLFRIILPFLGLFLLLNSPLQTCKLFFKILLLLGYSYFVSIYVGRFHHFDVVFFLHYSVILVFYLFVKIAVEEIGKEKMYQYIYFMFKTMIVLALIQYIFGGTYINTQDRSVPTIFFWNENEFSAVLGIIIPIVFLKEKRNLLTFLWIAVGIFFIIVSGARLALIGVILFFLIFLVKKIPIIGKGYFTILGAVLIVTFLLFYFKDVSFMGGISLGELIMMPIEHILKLEPLPNIGSIGPRTNAFIYGFQELKNTSIWGIGPGNSNTLMQENIIPGMEDWSARSMHNIILQTITELGYLGIVFMLWFMYRVYISIRNNKTYSGTVIAFFFVSSLIGVTMLSGAFNNYFFLMVLFFSIFYFDDNFKSNKDKEEDLVNMSDAL